MPVKILIIEDERDHAVLTKTILQQASPTYQPEFVCDAREGLKKVLEETPDVILCDYRMPHLTGFDILREIKTKGINIPFIVVTASGSEKIAVDFMKAGAYDYILKDLAYEDTLHMVIEKSLERYNTLQEKQRLEKEIHQAYMKLKEAQNELIQSEKMAALGEFSSGVAHEVRNPLSVILGGVEFLEMNLPQKTEDTTMAITKIKEATIKADSIIQGLLQFARPSEVKVENLNPTNLINDTFSFIKYRCPLANIEVHTDFLDDIGIKVDRNQTQQVLFNILCNAIESMPSGGKLYMKTYKAIVPEYSKDKQACVIEITDTGQGISKENLAKLFEPFFTTKRERRGTGLGLSIAKTIIDNHEGTLLIDSELGKGTTVKIVLPLSRGGGE
jgi:signal transduction histidine kinase